jgi:ATP adenylyltransferase
MDYLWSPWRYRYVTEGNKGSGCLFCEKGSADPSHDRDNLVLCRAQSNFVILNLFPYTTGHAMVAPYVHLANLEEIAKDTLAEMMELAQRVQAALRKTYNPDGYNLGMNLGRTAGAGIPDHLHLHVLPRWLGDSNFMTVIANTRVHPEEVLTTYDKLVEVFREQPGHSD